MPAASFRGEAEFQHDGKRHLIVMNVAALFRAEEESGVGLLGALMNGLVSLRITAMLLRAGLIEGTGQEYSASEAGNILLTNSEAFDAVSAALKGALPDAEGADADTAANPPKVATRVSTRNRGTGTRR